MAFALTQELLAKVDALLATYVTEISTRVIATATPFVTAMLTITFLMYAWLIMRRAVQMPIMDFLGRSMTIAIVASIALAGGLYQAEWAGIIVDLPDSMAKALLTQQQADDSAGSAIDVALGAGFNKATEVWGQISVMAPGTSILYVMAGVVILIFTAIFGGLGLAVLMVCKVATALLAALGPIFIMALLFQATRSLFDRWAAQILNYTILMVLFVAVFGLFLQMFGSYVDDMKFTDGIANFGWSMGGLSLIAVSGLFLMMQLPAIAAGLAGGVAVSFVAPVMTATAMGMGASRIRSAMNVGASAGRR